MENIKVLDKEIKALEDIVIVTKTTEETLTYEQLLKKRRIDNV